MLWCRRYPMTELENDDEWCLRFIICPRCLCDAIKRWRPPLALARELRKRILWLHSVICWAESTFYLSLSMGRWVVNSACAVLSRWLIGTKASLGRTWPWRQWQWAFACTPLAHSICTANNTKWSKKAQTKYVTSSHIHLFIWTF